MKRLLISAILLLSLSCPTYGAETVTLEQRLGPVVGNTLIEGSDAKIYRTKIATIIEMETQDSKLRVFGIQPDYDMENSQGQKLVWLIFGPELGSVKDIKSKTDTIENLKVKQVMVIHENGGVVYTLDDKTGALKFITVILKAPKTTDL